MIQDIEITTLGQAMRLLMDQEYNPDIDRMRSTFLFRGMPDARFSLTTSLRRNCGSRQELLEPAILRNFTKYAGMTDPTLGASVWKQMIVGQHHGLATRLLDWTQSPLVAMHFAETETNPERFSERDAIVWRIDANDLKNTLPDRYRDALDAEKSEIFSVEMLQGVVSSLKQYDEDMGDRSFVIVEPPSIDQRIISQYSFFSVMPTGMNDIEEFLEKHTEKTVRYIIRKEIRWDLRDMLDQFNMSERMMYPGLDGIAKWVTRHYYVKETLR